MSILDGVQRVLSLYAEGAAELSFTEVAARLAMPKSTASRLLNQMQHYGLLDQDAATPGLVAREESIDLGAAGLLPPRLLEALNGVHECQPLGIGFRQHELVTSR